MCPARARRRVWSPQLDCIISGSGGAQPTLMAGLWCRASGPCAAEGSPLPAPAQLYGLVAGRLQQHRPPVSSASCGPGARVEPALPQRSLAACLTRSCAGAAVAAARAPQALQQRPAVGGAPAAGPAAPRAAARVRCLVLWGCQDGAVQERLPSPRALCAAVAAELRASSQVGAPLRKGAAGKGA